MALADYFDKNLLAVSQLLAGYDEDEFRKSIQNTCPEIALGEQAVKSYEGRVLAELLVRLLARLYPCMNIVSSSSEEVNRLSELARGINPAIELTAGLSTMAVSIGDDAPSSDGPRIHVGSDGWDALLSTKEPQRVGTSNNPFGACAAACLAAANVFRYFFGTGLFDLDDGLAFSTYTLLPVPSVNPPAMPTEINLQELVIVGLGAIGNSLVWALSRLRLKGVIRLVDPQSIELSNIQRYVLTSRADEHRLKVDLAASFFDRSVTTNQHAIPWDQFGLGYGYSHQRVAVALDSAEDRRAVQASLPEWTFNAWTQTGDLGTSFHGFGGDSACLCCLYLPDRPVDSEDLVVARALGVEAMQMQVRECLSRGTPAPAEMLNAIGAARGIPNEQLIAYRDRPLRELYVFGLCGGVLVSTAEAGRQMHVPVAHQSALAGVLMAATILAHALRGQELTPGRALRLDLMKPVPEYPTQILAADPSGRCICRDPDFVDVYHAKYQARQERSTSPSTN